jgi:hypothetical protein
MAPHVGIWNLKDWNLRLVYFVGDLKEESPLFDFTQSDTSSWNLEFKRLEFISSIFRLRLKKGSKLTLRLHSE